METATKSYLLCYNFAQCLLWGHTIYLLCLNIPSHFNSPSPLSPSSVAALYKSISPSALLAQRISWLEVLHAGVGIAGGGVGAAFVQALGRSAVLLVLVELCQTARGALAAPLLIAAAAASDLTRYVFYVFSIFGACPRWLLVLRYSIFLPAYPLGITCEWLLYWVSLSEVDTRGIGKVVMPNSWNFAFDYGIWNRGVMAVYAYFGPTMFVYMWRQRKKKLAPSGTERQKSRTA